MPHKCPQITRLAPSPTGALHLGNARTFVINWILARRHGWRILLRIEDLDGPRVKPEFIEQTLQVLGWLGLDWDAEPTVQSHDLQPHAKAVDALAHAARAYPCELTRTEISRAASAPHADESELSQITRPPVLSRQDFNDRFTNWRFVTPERVVTFRDGFQGEQAIHPSHEVGDFVIWTKRGTPAYQLAVVVDDARQGVTQIVRGDDLVPSTGPQLLLYEALGLLPIPEHTHLPLVVGHDGRRLAKRHGDSRLETYRQRGVPVERVLGLLAHWSLPDQSRVAMDLDELAQRFELHTMPRGAARFAPEDDAWLLERC